MKKEQKRFVKDWQQAIKKECLVDIVKDMGNGWWLFQTKKNDYRYNGVLGWQRPGKKGFFTVYDPEMTIEYHHRRDLKYKEQNNLFTDGRQIRWISREFLPPKPRDFTINIMKQISAITDQDLADMDRIREKVKPFLEQGSQERADALKIAKANRKMLQEKFGPFNKPKSPDMPANVKNTLVLLNEETVEP